MISGGCLENDTALRAQQILKSDRTAETIIYDTTGENDLIWGVGLGCHGRVHVLIEKLPPSPSWAAALAANLALRRSTALAVVFRAPDPKIPGTRLASELSALDHLPGVEVFREVIAPSPSLVIFGAGDDARPLARLAVDLGWYVTVADPRPACVTSDRFPSAHRLVADKSELLADKVNPESDSAVVVMTHHYVHDLPLMRQLLPRPLAYLGLLGPRKRAENILAALESEGQSVTKEARARLYAPVGLDLGATTPEGIALSIMAELQAHLTSRKPIHLRDRSAPIHG
jgi:xanthine/CO dehydrogenase XdhC/CoxF family maturation factor